MTFAAALRSFLRQDPDVIMVGEIRDLETAEIAIKAAQTGHMVLSTLHTNDASQTIARLMNMGIAPYNITSSVTLVIAQRLARRLHDCKKPLSLPAAALLYRQGHVREASTTYVFAPSADELFNSMESPGNSVALRTASERGRLLIAIPRVAELPWLKASALPQGANLLRRAHESQIPADATQIVSDSGELVRNWEQGVFTIDTPRTQAVMGWVGGKVIALTDVEASVTTRNALVAVQSLDGKALRRSRQIMISVAARSLPRSDGVLPFYSEPAEGSVANAASMRLAWPGKRW